MVTKVKVEVHKSDVSYSEGYIASAEGMVSMWSTGPTIDATIEKFKSEYAGIMQMTFANGGKIEFDFHVIF